MHNEEARATVEHTFQTWYPSSVPAVFALISSSRAMSSYFIPSSLDELDRALT